MPQHLPCHWLDYRATRAGVHAFHLTPSPCWFQKVLYRTSARSLAAEVKKKKKNPFTRINQTEELAFFKLKNRCQHFTWPKLVHNRRAMRVCNIFLLMVVLAGPTNAKKLVKKKKDKDTEWAFIFFASPIPHILLLPLWVCRFFLYYMHSPLNMCYMWIDVAV